MSLPLKGIRIVDLGLYVAGPYASVPLAEWGAEVIKIEPLSGDPNRTIWRAFACCNRGKRTISLDLKSPEGLEIAKKICISADVVHHNFRPGVMDRIGLGYETLKQENADLIYLEASAYGADGPMSSHPGFDMIMQALCGHEAHGAGKGNTPLWMRWAPVDFTGGYLGTIGMLAGLYRKARENKGSLVRSNLLDGGIFMLSELVRHADGSFSGPPELNAEQTGNTAAYRLYACTDGWIAVVAKSPAQQQALASLAGLEETDGTPATEWSSGSQEKLQAYFAALGTEAALSALREQDVWAERCRADFQETLFENPQWKKAGVVREHSHPRNEHIRQIGNVVRLSGVDQVPESSGLVAEPGQHTREILRQFAYSEEDIEDFYSRKIVA